MKKGLRLGIDLGGTQVKVALVDEAGRLKASAYIDTVKDPRQLTAEVVDAVRPWLKGKILGTGIGVAGDVDPDKGVVRFSPNLGWKNVPLKKYFQSNGLPGPIFVENDANAAAWGAYHYELKAKSRNLVVLTLGTGVGGGLILDGKLYRGKTGSAGELGHVTIDPNGVTCGCGSSGCLETFLGASYLVAWYRKEKLAEGINVPAEVTPKDLDAEARKGDPVAQRVWRRAGSALGVGLANFINIFNPDTILLCGGIAGASDLLMEHARPEIERRAFDTPQAAVRIKTSVRNNHLGVIGSALLVE